MCQPGLEAVGSGLGVEAVGCSPVLYLKIKS